MNIYFLKCAIHRAICMIQHLQSFGIWGNGTKTVQNHPMQHTHTKICTMNQLFELSSLMIKISLEFWTPKIHAVTWLENLKDGMLYTIHSKEVQLISDNNPVHSVFVFYYNTNFITAYLFFSGEVASLFSRNCRIFRNLWLIPQGIITIYHNLFKMRDVLWNFMTGNHF